nr:uncharacterized protein LOC109192549 [Ipomoea batatas]
MGLQRKKTQPIRGLHSAGLVVWTSDFCGADSVDVCSLLCLRYAWSSLVAGLAATKKRRFGPVVVTALWLVAVLRSSDVAVAVWRRRGVQRRGGRANSGLAGLIHLYIFESKSYRNNEERRVDEWYPHRSKSYRNNRKATEITTHKSKMIGILLCRNFLLCVSIIILLVVAVFFLWPSCLDVSVAHLKLKGFKNSLDSTLNSPKVPNFSILHSPPTFQNRLSPLFSS